MKNASSRLSRFILLLAVLIAWAETAMAANMGLRTGVSRYFRTVSDPSVLSPNKTFTIEFWINPAGAGVILNEVDAWDISAWDYSLAEVTPAGDVVIGLPGIAGAAAIGRIPFNTWSHLALRYDATTSRYVGFINGQPGAGFLQGTRRLPSESGRQTYWAFGRTARSNLGNGGWLTADFDEIRIWNTARPDAEVATNYQASYSAPQTGLLINWHLDDGAGINISDSSGGNRVGYIENAIWVASSLVFGGPPLVSDVAHQLLPERSARLTGNVNPNSAETVRYFEYGATTSYGSGTPVVTLAAENRLIPVEATLQNLAPGTYNYRLIASNRFGANIGANRTFTITTLADKAATFTGNGFLRSGRITRPFFDTRAFTYELWFQAQGPGVMIVEVDQFSPSAWDYSFLEVRNDRTLLAGLPGLPTITGGTIEFGRWYHSAIRYNPVAQELDLFLDGAKVATSRGVRNVPWEANRTVFMAFGRGASPNLATVANSQFSLTTMEGNSTITFAPNGNGYTLERPGSPTETGTYTASWSGPTWNVQLTRADGIRSTLALAFTSATRGQFTLTQAGAPEVSGTFSGTNDLGVGAPFRGQIDEVRMWREALSDSVIAENRRLKLPGGDARLFAMWSLDVIQGQAEGFPTTPDRSGNENPALLVGSVTLTPSGADLIEDRRPSATTGSAVASSTGVTVSGSATSQTTGIAFFRFGLTELNSTTTPVQIGGGVAVTVEAMLQGLEPGATYSYALVASNEFGVVTGPTRTFVAPDLRPTAVTGAFEDLSGNAGILHGSATTSVPGVAYFTWGEAEMNRTTPPVSLTGGPAVLVQAILNNLEGGRTYQYALVVSNEFGIRTGATRTFTKLGWGGYAVVLSGSNFVRTQNDQRPYFSDETITAELWVKPAGAGVVMAEVDRTNPSALDSSIVEILANGSVVAGFPGVPTIMIGVVSLNQWSHIAIRYDRANQRLEGWVNGVKSQNVGAGDRVAGWEFGRQIIYTFGKGAVDRIGTGQFLVGELDEVRLWSTARTDGEIATNFDQKLFGSEAGMVAYYRFDERSATVTDHSRHNNTGAITGGTAQFVSSSARIRVDFIPIGFAQDGTLRLQFMGVPGRELRLQHSADLVTWTDGPLTVVNELGVGAFNAGSTSDAQLRFFRARQL